MKKKNREINIFSMSALDLFASAMGAFLLIAVIALPYYLKVDKNLIKEVKEVKKELQKEQEQRKKEQAQKEQLQKENEAMKKEQQKMQKELKKTFCVVNIIWDSTQIQDVDLHVVDPDGLEYYYDKLSYSQNHERAFLVYDSKNVTKGIEVWLDKKLKAGDYKIYYVYFAGHGPIKVFGSIYTKSFTKDLPPKSIRVPDRHKKILIATLHVDANGNTNLEMAD